MNNIKSNIVTFLILMFFFTPGFSCKSGTDETAAPKSKKTLLGIIVTDNTSIRIDPIIYSSRVVQLKKGEKVVIVDVSHEKSWIGKTSNFWYKIQLDNGMSGWVYGENIKTFKQNQENTAENYVINLKKEEEQELRKSLSGKWWSVNKRSEFTNHSLEMLEEGKYRSSLRGGAVLEGEYNFDFKQKQLVFIGKTTFGQTLNYVKRGQMYYLEADKDKSELRFTKISDDASENEAKETEKPAEGEKNKTNGENK